MVVRLNDIRTISYRLGTCRTEYALLSGSRCILYLIIQRDYTADETRPSSTAHNSMVWWVFNESFGVVCYIGWLPLEFGCWAYIIYLYPHTFIVQWKPYFASTHKRRSWPIEKHCSTIGQRQCLEIYYIPVHNIQKRYGQYI